MRPVGPSLALVALGCVALGLAGRPPSAAADVVPGYDSLLRPGQSFVGDVQPSETIRFTVELARGAKLRAKIALKVLGPGLYIPANFQRVSVTNVTLSPDVLRDAGIPVAFDKGTDAYARYDPKTRTSTFFVDDWVAPTSGRFQFAVTHLTKVTTRCTGRVSAIRKRRTVFTGTLESPEADRTVSIGLQPDDMIRTTVRRVKKASAPEIAEYTSPGGTPYRPSQKRSKTGAVTGPLYTFDFGDAVFVVGPQLAEAATGAYRGTITLKPGGPYGKVSLSIANPPGIPLSVRSNPDSFVDVTWATEGCGLAWDGVSPYILVTGESGGSVQAKFYDLNLTDLDPFGPTARLADGADLPGTDTVRGHRVTFLGGNYFVAFSSATGNTAGLVRVNGFRTRNGFSAVPTTGPSASPTRDLFITHDEFTVSVGLPVAGGHDVHGFDAASMALIGPPARIGGASAPHSAGASAVYRGDQNVFELWAPTTLAPAGPSDLHHGLFSPSWAQLSWEASRVADASTTESTPTSVVYDDLTGVTIVHYIVPDAIGSGFGIVRRRLFDSLGAEIAVSPANPTPLGTVRYNRPTALIVGNYLFLGLEGLVNPTIVRFQIQR